MRILAVLILSCVGLLAGCDLSGNAAQRRPTPPATPSTTPAVERASATRAPEAVTQAPAPAITTTQIPTGSPAPTVTQARTLTPTPAPSSTPSPTPTPTPLPLPTPTTPPLKLGNRALWSADHEDGSMSRWWRPGGKDHCGGQFNSGTGASDISHGIAHTGSHSARLSIRSTDEGDQGARLFRWCEAQDNAALYYSAWYYFPRRVAVGNWWIIMEWKSEGSYNPKFALQVGNRADGAMYAYLARGVDSGGGTWSQDVVNLPVGRWVHLETHYERATEDTARVTVWQDGAQILEATDVQTANSADLRWAIVNYGNHTSPTDIEMYVDDAAISKSRIGTGK